MGINLFIKKHLGQKRVYPAFEKHHGQNLKDLQQKISSEKVKDLPFNSEFWATLEEDYQKALDYCKKKNIRDIKRKLCVCMLSSKA
ncbi:MAG: hypothetical protein ACLFUZ_01330 [Candidatus Micrarchaeia archaeon]